MTWGWGIFPVFVGNHLYLFFVISKSSTSKLLDFWGIVLILFPCIFAFFEVCCFVGGFLETCCHCARRTSCTTTAAELPKVVLDLDVPRDRKWQLVPENWGPQVFQPSILSYFSVRVSNQYTLEVYQLVPEKWWLEDYFPIGMVHFQGLC